MVKLLVPISIVMVAPAVVIFLCLADGLQFRRLTSRNRLARWASRVRFPDLISRVNSFGVITCSKLRESISRVKLSELICRFNISGVANRAKCSFLGKAHAGQGMAGSTQPDLNVLNCRVQPAQRQEHNCTFGALAVEICGSIHAPSDMHYTTLRISITDVTDGIHRAKPVQACDARGQIQDRFPSSAGEAAFCYNADLGKLPNQVTTLADWTEIAQLNVDRLIFPRKGARDLQFTISLLSCQTGQELGCARCTVTYDNPALGYIDLRENLERTKTLAVALAFAVSAADHKLYDCEIELIRDWVQGNIGICRISPGSSHGSDRASHKLDKAFKRTVAFFRDGNQLDIYKICKEIVETSPVAARYDILEFCLNVARANGSVAAEELAILKSLATWLEVDMNRFHSMMERVLPVSMHQVKDAEAVLGLSSDMSAQETLQQLNKQYSKWNSRVTSSNVEVQAQADLMLKLIAEARAEYIA